MREFNLMDLQYKTFVFIGPSAIGKTYIADQIMKRFPGKFEQSKLYTTRKPRKNETATDRIFVSEQKFKQMVNENVFLIYDNFGGNFYGFSKDSLYPSDKHLLVNIWPWLCKDITKLPHAIVLGLQAPKHWEKVLIPRMRSRGDSDKTIATRKKLIAKDIKDLENNKDTVKAHGAFFVIKDDSTVENEIIPWIEKKLGLKA